MIISILKELKELLGLSYDLCKMIGFKNLIRCVLLSLIIVVCYNFKTLAINFIEFYNNTSEELHYERMNLRDQYMNDLGPILTELRVKTNADRVLYFEYHNSESNLEGVPFKFFDLMKYSSNFEAPKIMGNQYKDIGASMYSELFQELNKGNILVCNGIDDMKFRNSYSGVYELFHNVDKSRMQLFFGVPGVKRYIGFIVLEWLDEDNNVIVNLTDIYKTLPRISAIGATRLKIL